MRRERLRACSTAAAPETPVAVSGSSSRCSIRRPGSPRMRPPPLNGAGCTGPPPTRRREMRRATRLGCTVRAMDTWKLVGDRTLDLSPQGMLLLSDERIDCGTELVVSFQATEL